MRLTGVCISALTPKILLDLSPRESKLMHYWTQHLNTTQNTHKSSILRPTNRHKPHILRGPREYCCHCTLNSVVQARSTHSADSAWASYLWLYLLLLLAHPHRCWLRQHWRLATRVPPPGAEGRAPPCRPHCSSLCLPPQTSGTTVVSLAGGTSWAGRSASATAQAVAAR